LLVALACGVRAEIRPMTLRQAVATALKQNPDIALARLDAERARAAVRLAKDPFLPRIVVGSGLAYSNGFPMSIEGSAPSVIQAHAVQDIFNRPQSFAVAQAKENARGAEIAITSKRDEVVYRTASLFLDAERAARIGALAAHDTESLARVLATVQALVAEGRALPLAAKQAQYNLARARQVAEGLEDDQAAAESSLAEVLGYPSGDRVRPEGGDRPLPQLPESPERAVESALESNTELRRMESQLAVKELDVRAARAQRLPRVDLVAEYGMLARFNNYDEFFRKFQRNNGELGVSFQLPLLAGPGVSSQVAQSKLDIAKLRIQMGSARRRISEDIEQAFRDVHKAETAADVARLDLEVARDQLSLDLSLVEEGRMTLRQVEEARVVENDKWIALYDARYAVERSQWNVLRLTGGLLAFVAPATP
jgi:outer membrane protein